ncbi:hypothetical protein KM043_007338 [Ampulex compressa]|nr:hypothetical protein KM043_007338 [Ampulex compressa]
MIGDHLSTTFAPLAPSGASAGWSDEFPDPLAELVSSLAPAYLSTSMVTPECHGNDSRSSSILLRRRFGTLGVHRWGCVRDKLGGKRGKSGCRISRLGGTVELGHGRKRAKAKRCLARGSDERGARGGRAADLSESGDKVVVAAPRSSKAQWGRGNPQEQQTDFRSRRGSGRQSEHCPRASSRLLRISSSRYAAAATSDPRADRPRYGPLALEEIEGTDEQLFEPTRLRTEEEPRGALASASRFGLLSSEVEASSRAPRPRDTSRSFLSARCPTTLPSDGGPVTAKRQKIRPRIYRRPIEIPPSGVLLDTDRRSALRERRAVEGGMERRAKFMIERSGRRAAGGEFRGDGRVAVA